MLSYLYISHVYGVHAYCVRIHVHIRTYRITTMMTPCPPLIPTTLLEPLFILLFFIYTRLFCDQIFPYIKGTPYGVISWYDNKS